MYVFFSMLQLWLHQNKQSNLSSFLKVSVRLKKRDGLSNVVTYYFRETEQTTISWQSSPNWRNIYSFRLQLYLESDSSILPNVTALAATTNSYRCTQHRFFLYYF